MASKKKSLTPKQRARVERAGTRAESEGRNVARAKAAALGHITRQRQQRSVASARGAETRELIEHARRQTKAGVARTFAPKRLPRGGIALYAAPRDSAGAIEPDAAFAILQDVHGALLGKGADKRNTRGEKVAPLIAKRLVANVPPGTYELRMKIQRERISEGSRHVIESRIVSRTVYLSGSDNAGAITSQIGEALRGFYEREGNAKGDAILLDKVYLSRANDDDSDDSEEESDDDDGGE